MKSTRDEWTRDELRDSIKAYKEIQTTSNVVKNHIYERLAAKHPIRTTKAFERRMMNISYVLSLAGRDWATGLKPLKNVGANRVKEIEELLAEIENRSVDLSTIDNAERSEALKKVHTIPSGKIRPNKTLQPVTTYERSYQVVAWILYNAKGNCELCHQIAPFDSFEGIPYLEVHHVKHLADGGSDTITNAVAVCPNCHRALHYAIDKKERREKLYLEVKRLIRE